MQPGDRPTPAGERWSVNMPAVIGVAFVFVVGVVIWVAVSAGGDDDGDVSTPGTTAAAATTAISSTSPVSSAAPATTTPAPLPSIPSASTEPPTSTPSTIPPTTAPGAGEGAVPGDLAVPGRPMQQPPCDGSFITVLASPIGAQATGPGVGAVLDQYPGSNYLRTDQTCPSLSPDADGAPIYVIFFGPYAFESDACTARADGSPDAYARQLSDEIGPDHSVSCT